MQEGCANGWIGPEHRFCQMNVGCGFVASCFGRLQVRPTAESKLLELSKVLVNRRNSQFSGNVELLRKIRLAHQCTETRGRRLQGQNCVLDVALELQSL